MNKKTLLNFWLLLLCMIVGGASSAWGQTYKKVTSEPQDWSGEYLLVSENSTTANVWTGIDASSGYSVSTTISNNSITKPSGAATLTIASMSGGYSILIGGGTNNGMYLYGKSSKADMTFGNSASAHTISIANSAAKIVWKTNSTRWIQTNSGRFRYYASGYGAVQLYKLAYTVNYDANGGSGTITDSNSPYFSGSTVTVKSNTFTRDGYTFTGWNTKANGSGTPYAAGATFNISENTTLYAQWVAAGDYINSTPSSADIAVAGVVAEFSLSTNLAAPSYAIKYYTTADGDVEASKPAWLGDVEFSGSTLDIVVNANTGAARTAYFKVYSGDTYSDVITINQAAYVAVTSVSLDITSKTLLVDGTVTLEATVNPDNASYKTVTWESDDTDVATVNSSGKVTAVAAGTAIITVKSTDDSTKKATCAITVTDGSIDLDATGEIEITSFPSFSGSGYQSPNPYTIGGYDWIATNCMKDNGDLQMKASVGTLQSPTIKSTKGFTVTVTVSTNSVTVSDGTSSASTSNGVATLTTTKTSTTITIAAGSSYAKISKIKITPNKDPIATGVSITDPGTLAAGATGTFSASSTDADECTKAWSSNNSSVITITNESTGAYTATGRGTAKITYTITPEDTENYSSVSAERTVSVTAPVVITASDVAMIYGDAAKAIGATTSAGYAGTLTYASGNTSIATVDASGNVTAVAAGTTTITISAPADAENLYTAGEDKIINVTVTAPASESTAADFTQLADVYETLLSNTKKSGWTYTEWTSSSSYGACSTSGTAGQLITEDYLIPNLVNPCVYFEHTGNLYFSSPSSACKLYVQEGSKTPVELEIPTYFAGNDWTYVGSGDIDISDYIGKTVHFIFDYSPSTGNNGKWEVKKFGIYYDAFGVKLNASGYATYCSQYPLDFSKENAEDKGFTAWQVTDVSSETITFSQITSGIKGGQGIFLKGSPNAVVTLTSADSSEELDDNLFIGTTAPTYLTQVNGDYTNFALSAKYSDFRKIKTGIVPANKAYLPVPNTKIPAAEARLTFVFEDDQTTTIQGVSVRKTAPDTYYNMKGQRVDNPKKGGIYVKNGKKVIFK